MQNLEDNLCTRSPDGELMLIKSGVSVWFFGGSSIVFLIFAIYWSGIRGSNPV